MDMVGVLMGWATVPMASLTVASLIAGLVLVALGAWSPLAVGIVGSVACYALAPLLETVIIAIDDAAARALGQRERFVARSIAVLSSGVPVAIILGWEIVVFTWFHDHAIAAPRAVVWLWSYGVAVGPWTVFALRVSRFRRTLCGIRAYAGHLAFWLLSAVVLGLKASPAIALTAMLLPSILPFVVGFLLALADRDALTNVRI